MAMTTPQYSTNRATKAGDRISKEKPLAEDWIVFENFRNSHNYILNTFRPTLIRHITNKKNTIFAQRLKRKNTIIDKLKSGRAKDYGKMHDLAGCRLVFKSISDLEKYRKKLHGARFKHERINGDKYNYIANVKPTGYRGIHDVYKYSVSSEGGKIYNGLLIEIQYRTVVQHAWATAVEISDFLNKSRVKFETGTDPKRERFFILASELLARHFEELTGALPQLSKSEINAEFITLEKELNIIAGLKKLHKERIELPISKNIVLHFAKERLIAKGFRSSTLALEHLTYLETAHPSDDVVYVHGNNPNHIKSAFRNYFRDSKEFVSYIEATLA
jgi:ppGpp synthetase/RelA/SpoT-type nucleotidyltranferase